MSKCSCGNAKHAIHVACGQCWAHVPAPLQQRVRHLYKTARGSDSHREAVGEAYRAIHAARRAPGAQHRPSEF